MKTTTTSIKIGHKDDPTSLKAKLIKKAKKKKKSLHSLIVNTLQESI